MTLIKTIVFIFVLSDLGYVLSDNSLPNNVESTTSRDKDIDINRNLCNEKNCIMKCCPLGKYFKVILKYIKGRERPKKQKKCVSLSNPNRDIFNLQNESIFFNHPTLSNDIIVKPGIFADNKQFMKESVDVANLDNFNVHLNAYPKINLETPNAYDRWVEIPNNRFCWDYYITDTEEVQPDGSNVLLKPGIWVVFENTDEPSRTSTDLLTSAMLVSCFFLLVVLAVYIILPELRNLCGMILMMYVASLFGALLLLAVMRLKQHERHICLRLTYVIYYLFLASFCWMNVMSYDIWWTFRGYAKARPIHRRGVHFKFAMYCLYAFGLPLAMIVMLAVLNHIPMTHKPWVVTPKIPDNGCFIEGGEKFLYLYIPMLILIVCNWLFFLMTAFNIWRLSRGTAVLDSAAAGTPQAHRTHRHRLMVYVKLSVVMGLNWVLEVVSYKFPGYSVWFVTDFYNILIGVSIFLIFVCKRKILRKLMKQYLRFKSNHWHPGKENSMRSSSSDSSASNETQTLQVCVNPKGPGYVIKTV